MVVARVGVRVAEPRSSVRVVQVKVSPPRPAKWMHGRELRCTAVHHSQLHASTYVLLIDQELLDLMTLHDAIFT